MGCVGGVFNYVETSINYEFSDLRGHIIHPDKIYKLSLSFGNHL
jgi:hypothetical protein